MKQLFAAAAVLAAGLMLETGGANAASLSGNIGAGSYNPWAGAIQEVGNKHKNKHRKHKNRHHKKKRHGHKKHHNHGSHHHKHNNGGFFLSFGPHGPEFYNNRYDNQYARNCQDVVTDGYFRGRYAKLGGTMCYDRAGNGYMVDGSRYLIHYY